MLRRLGATSPAVLFVLVMTSLAEGQTSGANGKSNAGQGALPNGKPFQQIQSQLTQVEQEIQALQGRIDAVEQHLQRQINDTYARLGQLQEQIVTVADGIAALQQRVADNQTVISMLELAAAALRAQLDSVQAQLAAANGTVQGLSSQASSLQTLIGVHHSQILGLASENAGIEHFLANLASGACQGGQAISAIGSSGVIACSQAGTSSGGVLSSYLVRAIGLMTPNSPSSLAVACQPGYVATGGGHVRPSFNEAVPYVSSLTVTPVNQWFYNGTTWNLQFTGHSVQSSYGYLQKDPISLLASRPTSGGYQVQFLYAPQLYTSSPSFEAWATCVKAQ